MSENTCDAETESDRDVCPNRAKAVRADEAQQCADPQGTEDQTDESSQEPDQGTGRNGRAPVDPLGRTDLTMPRPQEIDAEDEQRHADDRQQRVARNLAGKETAGGGGED